MYASSLCDIDMCSRYIDTIVIQFAFKRRFLEFHDPTFFLYHSKRNCSGVEINGNTSHRARRTGVYACLFLSFFYHYLFFHFVFFFTLLLLFLFFPFIFLHYPRVLSRQSQIVLSRQVIQKHDSFESCCRPNYLTSTFVTQFECWLVYVICDIIVE